MINLTSRVLKDILTERDGVSFDVTKVQWFIGTLVYFGCTVWTVWKHPELGFDFVKWAMGFSSILAAGSFGVQIKSGTEQPISPQPIPGDGKQ